jgi:hypothetical protein
LDIAIKELQSPEGHFKQLQEGDREEGGRELSRYKDRKKLLE